jgi:hypothetical protein
MIDLVAGTKHRKEALAYINAVLDPLPQLGLANELPYGSSNKLLGPIFAAYPELSKKFPSSPEDLKQLREIDWPVFNRVLPRAVNLWNRQVAK